MKKQLVLITAALCLLLTGCGSAPAIESAPAPTPVSTQTPAPSASATEPAPELDAYTADGSVIYSGSGEAIYDAAPNYRQGWSAWISSLTPAYGALYFIEDAAISSDTCCEPSADGSSYSVVKIAPDGSNRQVLVSAPSTEGYIDIAPFADGICYIGIAEDGIKAGYVGKDGGDASPLSLSVDDADPVFIDATLDTDGTRLTITADYFSSGSDTLLTATWHVDESLTPTLAE